jgi:hypothetical protein
MVLKKYTTRNSPPLPANNHKWAIEEGNDGEQYVSRPDKNNIFRWKKINQNPKKAYDYYKQILPAKELKKKFNDTKYLTKMKAVAKELKKHKIFVYHLEWGTIQNFIDHAWDDVMEFIAKATRTNSNIEIMDNYSFVFSTESQLFSATTGNGTLYLQHNILAKDRKLIDQVFKKHFAKVKVPVSKTKAMEIKLDKK